MPEVSGITPEYLAFLKHEERLVLHPYPDPVGLPTIGYGHRIPSMNHPPVTEEWALATLIEDLRRFRQNALALSPGLANEPERRLSAIIDQTFNAGSAAYGASTLRKRVNEKNWPAAGAEMRRWVYGTDAKTGEKIKLPGLVRRRGVMSAWLENP